MEAYLFSFAVPYLLAAIAVVAMLRLAGMNVSKRPGRLIAAGIPLILILLPFKQVPLARLVTGLNANFSITLTALLFALLLREIQGIHLFDRRALRTISLSGLVVGLCLYPCSMNLVPFDLYRFGWGSVFLLAPLFLLTIFLILTGNRAGFVLAASVAAYALRLLESDNLWDYLVDPFLISWCLITSIVECFSRVRSFISLRGAGVKG
jgi:hypothetical protein